MQPLVTVQEFESWVGIQSNTANDALASVIINGWTQYVYWVTGRQPDLFVSQTSFTEVRDGNGSNVMWLLNDPIISVSSVIVNGQTIPASTGYGNGGWFIQQNADSIAIRSSANYIGFPFPHATRSFVRGKGNVTISYTAGYSTLPPDLYLATEKACTVIWNRRLREDEGSKVIPQTGQSNYRSWPFPPDVVEMLRSYRRTAMVGA